jgi:hypothetical protein
LTGTVEVKIAAVLQVASFGPNKVNVIVPVGEAPPASVAVSRIELPNTAVVGEA